MQNTKFFSSSSSRRRQKKKKKPKERIEYSLWETDLECLDPSQKDK